MAVYRFLPVEDSGPLFTICFDPERSEPVKTCVIRACLTLIQGGARFHWQKPLDHPATWTATRGREILAVRTPFFSTFHVRLIVPHCRALLFVVSRLIAQGLLDGLRLDQERNELSQSLFQIRRFSFLVYFRSGGRLRYSSSLVFSHWRTWKIG